MKASFDPSRIRRYYIQDQDGQKLVQFTAVGDKHRMIKQDDGSIIVEKLIEEGKEYNYGDPMPMDKALDILMENTHPSHLALAGNIQRLL